MIVILIIGVFCVLFLFGYFIGTIIDKLFEPRWFVNPDCPSGSRVIYRLDGTTHGIRVNMTSEDVTRWEKTGWLYQYTPDEIESLCFAFGIPYEEEGIV